MKQRALGTSVSIIIPGYNGTPFLARCLESALRETAALANGSTVLLVDNGSTDGTAAFCSTRFRTVRVLRLASNLGFAKACDLGIRASQGPYCLLLNQDAWLQPGCLQSLVSYAESTGCSVAGPKILNVDGSLQSPGLTLDFLGQPSWAQDISQLFFVTGAVMLIERSAYLALGGFDTRFFAYFEEADLQWRAHLHGLTIGFVPWAEAYHLGDTALLTHSKLSRLPPLGWRRQFLGRRNQLAMLLKNYSTLRLAWVIPTWLAAGFVEAIGALVLGRPTQVGAYGAAIAWNLKNLPDTWHRRLAVQSARVLSDRVLAGRFGQPFVRLRTAIKMTLPSGT
jgi:GT2 family glycosyltransferase